MNIHNIHHGDFGDDHWLVLLEDDGPSGLGRILGYIVFETEADAQKYPAHRLDIVTEDLGLFLNEAIPSDVVTEIMSYRDFKDSYGNRMPLHNRVRPEERR